jgi:hypothetical protein
MDTLAGAHVTGKLFVSSAVSAPDSPNGPNPHDFILYCSNPFGNAATGALWFSTNYHLYQTQGVVSGVRGSVDDCFVTESASAGTLVAQLDANTVLDVPLNGFTIDGGSNAVSYLPEFGSVSLSFSNGGQQVNGSVDISTLDFFARPVYYKASLTGSLAP